jgi:hypothetical protein
MALSMSSFQPEDDSADIPLTSDSSQHISISGRSIRNDEVVIHPEPPQRQSAINHASSSPGVQDESLDTDELRGSAMATRPTRRNPSRAAAGSGGWSTARLSTPSSTRSATASTR